MKTIDHTQIHKVPGLFPDADQRYLLHLLLSYGNEPKLGNFPCIEHRDTWLSKLIKTGKSDPRVRDLLPLAYQCLSKQNIELKEMAYLRSVRTAFAGRNHQQADAWRAVVRQLQSAGVNLVLLKGNSLVVDYYEDPTLRPMTDADILINIGDQDRAQKVLHTLGWRKVDCDYDATNPEFEHATPYTRLGKEWSDIDLHVHVLSKCHHPNIDQWFFDQVEPFEFCGVETHRFNPTALLTHLLLHGLRYSMTSPIRWIVDCHRVLRCRSDDINWQEMLAFAEKHQFTLRISLALLYLHEEYGTVIPTAVIDQLKQHCPSYFERMETAFLFKPFPSNASLLLRSFHLFAFITWRASRMRGGLYLPLDFIRIIRHMIAGRTLHTAFKRAWRYGKNN